MFKDAILDKLADNANIAQFVSFSPTKEIRYSRIHGYAANSSFSTISEAVATLLTSSPDGTVNVRSFKPDLPQGNSFYYGLDSVSDILSHIKALTSNGYYVIVNETVDVEDGGVSGVLQSDYMEFASGTIPRFVEKDTQYPVPTLSRQFAIDMLKIVYGFSPDITNYNDKWRVEFSIHPKPRGLHKKNTIIWEEERVKQAAITPFFSWPNPFSKLIGDKAYGLLVGHLLGCDVPRTTVFPRNPKLSLFTFGLPTGSEKKWTRTCPSVQEPGLFTTINHWVDPYKLMQKDDPKGEKLASCIVQDGVKALYSGALITEADENVVIEGVQGYGDKFMLGAVSPKALPKKVHNAVMELYRKLYADLGSVRFEWAYDGNKAWLLQLHKGTTSSVGRIIYSGKTAFWIDYYVNDGLEELRRVIIKAQKNNSGVKVHGNVGMSSHIADVLRKAQIPSFMA